MKLDKNQFLLLATAIGAAATTAAKTPEPTSITSASDGLAKPDDEAEQDTAGSCDGNTGQTGRAKYCPIAEGRRKGCLDWVSCDESNLKAASELRLFDCLAAASTNACAVEGSVSAYERCGRAMTAHACSDPTAGQVCQRVSRACSGHQGSMMASCATFVAPLTAAGKASFQSCMIEGCDDYQFKSCLGYMR